MALSGVHITCAYVGGRDGEITQGMLLVGAILWSRTMAAPGVTDAVVPGAGEFPNPPFADAVFEVRPSLDIFMAWGPSPDASKAMGSTRSTARIFIPAGETRDVFANRGDRVAWVAA